MNKAAIEQVRSTLEACRVKHQEFGQVPAKNQREIDEWRFHMDRIEAALTALSSAWQARAALAQSPARQEPDCCQYCGGTKGHWEGCKVPIMRPQQEETK